MTTILTPFEKRNSGNLHLSSTAVLYNDLNQIIVIDEYKK